LSRGNQEPQSPQSLILDFSGTAKSKSKTIPRRKLILGKRNIKTLTIEFQDGGIETYQIPDDQGFFRERWTYEEQEDSHKIENKLIIREIFWALREKYDAATMG
jgi:hypothetical protein